MVSSVCQPGLEGVAEAVAATVRLFQLYLRGDRGWVDDHVVRAIAAGYAAFCLTVVSAFYSRRERDLASRYVAGGGRRTTGHEFQAVLDWQTVEHIKAKFDVPLILKGISTGEDAKIVLDDGVDIILVSNHVGRQLNHELGSFDLLREVAGVVQGRAADRRRRLQPQNRYSQRPGGDRQRRGARARAMRRPGQRGRRILPLARASRDRDAAQRRTGRRDVPWRVWGAASMRSASDRRTGAVQRLSASLV